MMKNTRKLTLNKESLRSLSTEVLSTVVSGKETDPFSDNGGAKSRVESQCFSCASCLAVSCGCNPTSGLPATS